MRKRTPMKDGSGSSSSSSNSGSSDTENDDSSAAFGDDSSDDESEGKVGETFDGESEANPNPALYKSSICAKSLKSSDSLRVHRLSHENSKPFRCTDCGHRSAIRSNLVKYIRRVHFNVPRTRKAQLEKNGAVDTRNEGDHIHRDDQILQEASTNRKNESNLNPSKVQSGSESNSVKAKTAKGKSAKRTAPRKHLPCYFNQLGLCNSFFVNDQSRRDHYRIHLSIRPFSCVYPDCTDNYRAEARPSVLWHIRTVHLGLPGKVRKQKALRIKESRDARAYLAVDKELLNPCFTNLPEIEQEIETDN